MLLTIKMEFIKHRQKNVPGGRGSPGKNVKKKHSVRNEKNHKNEKETEDVYTLWQMFGELLPKCRNRKFGTVSIVRPVLNGRLARF